VSMQKETIFLVGMATGEILWEFKKATEQGIIWLRQRWNYLIFLGKPIVVGSGNVGGSLSCI